MAARDGAGVPPLIPAQLTRTRRIARATLWFERIWPAVWPALGTAGLYAAAALLGLLALLPAWPRVALLAATLLAVALLLWRGLRLLAPPSEADADRRIERATGLRHRPLASLDDRPVDASPEAELLWREHLRRLTAQIGRLRIGSPRPGLAARDFRALRAAVVVLLAAGLVVAGPDTGARLRAALLPTVPTTSGVPTQVQAWATPPAYTGLPPVVLRTDAQDARVPAGSHLIVSVTGGGAVPDLSVGDKSEPFHALDEASFSAEADLPAAGTPLVAIRRHGTTIGSWRLSLIPDQPPVPAFTEPPGPNLAAGRETGSTRFAWQATDDYGVTGAQIELHLKDRPNAPPLLLNAPVGGVPKAARGTVLPDLTPHPWAGLPVLARVLAKDATGQVGRSDEAALTLPERDFHHPVARALIAVRRQLSLTPDERRGARMVIDALAEQPDAVDGNSGALLNLGAISALLARGREPDTVEEAQARMWELAVALEENAPERTAQNLEQARENLRDATDPSREEKAGQEEIDRRVEELREAIQKHLEALAEQARRDDTLSPFDPSLPQMNARQLDRLAQQLQQSLREGRQEDAKRQMAELEKLLEKLQNARPETREERDQRRAQQRQRGQEQQDAVQDMVSREGKLLDQSESRANAPRPLPGQTPPAPQASNADRAGDAKSQAAMRRALGELMQRFGDLTGEVPAPLGEADQAMREAGQALADGKDAAASGATRRAIEALQKGGREMGQQMAQQFGTGQQEGEGEGGEGSEAENGDPFGANGNRPGRTAGAQPGDRSQSAARRNVPRDPLGRPLQQGTSGDMDSGGVRVPDEMEQARTRDLQEELRRRGADRSRPKPELDYIDRLLTPF